MLPREAAIEQIKKSIRKSYGRKGEAVVAKNFAAVDAALARLSEVKVPAAATNPQHRPRRSSAPSAPEFVRRVTALMLAGRGEEIPVSLHAGRRHVSFGHQRL